MGLFDPVSPGTPKSQSPANKSAWLNAVSRSAAWYQNVYGAGNGKRGALAEFAGQVKVRNKTDKDLRRGDCLQLGKSLIDHGPPEAPIKVDARRPWFEGNRVEAPFRRVGVLLKPLEKNEIGPLLMVGVCIAWVDVVDVAHAYAMPSTKKKADDAPEEEEEKLGLVSSDSGFAEILSPIEETGEQEVLVALGSTVNVATIAVTSDVPAATWNAETKKLTPASFDGIPMTGHDDGEGLLTFDPEADPTRYRSHLFDAVTVSENKFRVGYVLDDLLIQVSCVERDMPDSSPEP